MLDQHFVRSIRTALLDVHILRSWFASRDLRGRCDASTELSKAEAKTGGAVPPGGPLMRRLSAMSQARLGSDSVGCAGRPLTLFVEDRHSCA